MEGEGGGEGGEKRTEIEMDVTPQQDTIYECRCNYSVHVLSRITDHHYYEVFSHAYLHVQCTCTRALLHTTRVLVVTTHMHTRIWMNGCYSVSIRNAHLIHSSLIIPCVYKRTQQNKCLTFVRIEINIFSQS